MSLPPLAKWIYNFHPKENSAEAYTASKLIKGIDWV
jgi:coproporphyrinogen III oxidase